ncbi:hypothetical protein ABZP36_032838 [Zizania latifolia]
MVSIRPPPPLKAAAAMEEPDGEAHGREDHVAAARLEGDECAGAGGGLPMIAVPEVGDGLGDDKKVCGGQERHLSKDGVEYNGVDFAAKLVESVEDISSPFEGRGQIGEEKDSSLQEGPMDVVGEKQASFPVEYTEPSNLQTCRVPNGRLWNRTLSAPLSEGIFSSDNGRVRDMLDKATDRSICEHDGLAGNEGDLGGMTEVRTTIEDLQMVCMEPCCNSGGPGLSDLCHHSEQLPRVVDGLGFMANANNELKQVDLMPKIEAEVSRSVDVDSIPSFSGIIDDSLDGKEGCAGETFCDLGTCHVAKGDLWSNVLCTPFGEGYHSKDAGHTIAKVNKVTEGSPCGQGDLVGEGGILSGRGQVKNSLGDIQICSKESHCDNKGLPYLVEFGDGTGKLPCDGDGLRLITDANHELVYNSPIDVPLDKKAGLVGKISENTTYVEKLAHDSLGEVMLSCDSRIRTEATGDENRHFMMDVPKGLVASVCKAENKDNIRSFDPCAELELPLQNDNKYATSEFPPERDLASSSHNQPWEDDPCYNGRETSAFFLGHQDSVGIELESSDHLAHELDTCNSNNEKAFSADFVENGNDRGLHNQKVAPVIFFRRRNPVRAASSRNSNIEKSDQINKASNNTRKSKKVDNVRSLLKSTMIKFPNKTTKRRSVIDRPLNLSAWGSLQKLMDGFDQNCGPSTSHSHQICLGKERSNKRSDEKKQLTIRKSRSSRCSKNKNTSFSDIGYAAGELNGPPTFSVMPDTNVSSGHIGNVPKSGHHALFNASDSAHRTAQCVEGNHTIKFTSTQTDAQQLERGLENITQGTCPAYIHVDCATSTSERSLNNANVGFSPDSVLDIASVTCESNTPASLDVIVRENPSDHGGLTGCDLRASALASSDCGNDHVSSLDLELQAKTVRGNETIRNEDVTPSHAMMDNDIDDGKIQTLEKSSAARKNRHVGKKECQTKDGKKGKNIRKNRNSMKISFVEDSKLVSISNDSSSLDPSELLLNTQDVGMHGYDSMQDHFVTDNDNVEESAFDSVKSTRRKKKDGHGGKKGKKQNTHGKGRSKKKNIADNTVLDCGSYSLPAQLSDLSESHMSKQSDLNPAAVLAFKNSAAMSTELPANVACKIDGASVPPPQRAAWACCDDCQKWRCIPAELADIIGETNSRWTCKENGDKNFSDCSIPQEKTNAEINAELELSEASADEASRTPSWTHVRSNLFLHRNRRTQSIDESMVCNCKPPQDGRMGCGDGCLNRILNIECTKRTCPCEEHCSNQQFQRRNYAKLSWFHYGKKGCGLQLKEDVSEGRFLIEYVGEVLDIAAYESRQRYYASKGQKHFYFMALNGGEVIDACTKGNLGRFINHSCSPNCRTEKWMVNGEVCIGIFATRNIKKGEELTFDYNYVRVSGAAPQKCFCGTAKCRGYIGGDISGADMIAQDDAEAGDFESMAVDKDAEEVLGDNGLSSHDTNLDIVDCEASNKTEDSNDCPSVTPELEPEQQTSGTLFDTSELENSLEALSPEDAEDVIRTPVHVSRTVESTLQQLPVYGTQSSEILQKTPYTLDEPKAQSVMNGIKPGSDLGSNLVPSLHANKKNNLKHHWNVKPSSTPVDNVHILGVEGRLNSLLDENGGISKRKDATNGYLKLLFVTASEGDNAGGTSKSVRDLSLILDALLKTKSRTVLLDIINMNGLQMLHNILKQNRSSFHRIPIIRKLLKVLEFLASKEILTAEHINCGPRCAGMESFRDSMLGLTRHTDMQVHQIARSFRDRWIPRNILRSEPTEYSRASIPAHDTHGIVSTSTYSMDWKSIRRKRKSRWDYQPDDHYKMAGLKIQKVCQQNELDLQTGLMGNKLSNWGTQSYHNNVPVVGILTEGLDDEAPPGFESQQESWPAQACLGSGVSPGLSLDRYQHNMNISYGIPITIVQHFGTPEVGDQCHKKWKVAPGVPFHPFPPLPPYPRGSPCPSTQMSQYEKNSSGYCGRTADRDGRMHKNWRNGARARSPYNHQGQRFANDHRRFDRCQPPRSQEQCDSGSRGRE